MTNSEPNIKNLVTMISESYIQNIFPAKLFENNSNTIEINTEPWVPECKKCLDLENPSSTSFTMNSTVDTSEYVKALNYINSIHNLINLSLTNGDIKLNMPNLPNFLAIF